MIHRSRRFDDRVADFLTGRKVSPPMDERRICACCGQRIVKGWILSNADHVGDDCEVVITRAADAKQYGGLYSAEEFAAQWKRTTGWTLKPAVFGYLERSVF